MLPVLVPNVLCPIKLLGPGKIRICVYHYIPTVIFKLDWDGSISSLLCGCCQGVWWRSPFASLYVGISIKLSSSDQTNRKSRQSASKDARKILYFVTYSCVWQRFCSSQKHKLAHLLPSQGQVPLGTKFQFFPEVICSQSSCFLSAYIKSPFTNLFYLINFTFVTICFHLTLVSKQWCFKRKNGSVNQVKTKPLLKSYNPSFFKFPLS
jgi:hypothetical protein